MTRLINKIIESLKGTVTRFPVTIILLSLFSCISVYFIISENFEPEVLEGLGLALSLSLLGELAYDYGLFRHRWITIVVPVLAGAAGAAVLYKIEDLYPELATAGIICASVMLVFWVLYRRRKNVKVLSHLIKSFFLSGVASGIVNSGFTVCVLAFSFLLFEIDDVYKVLFSLTILTGVWFYGILCLSFLPGREEELSVPKVYRILIHKGLFYIYLLLIGILYAYIAKVIITRDMPVGRFNWFGCFSLTFYVLFYLSVDSEDGKIQDLFKKFGALLMIPVVTMQIIGLYIRISSYGLTMLRLASIVLMLVAAVFMLSSLVRLPVKIPFFLTAVLLIVFTCTPANLIDLPNRDQERRLEKYLSEAGALDGLKINEDVKLSGVQIDKISSPYHYLLDSPGTKSIIFENLKKLKIGEIIASSGNQTSYGYELWRSFEYYTELHGNQIDISEYKTMESVITGKKTYEEKDLSEFFLSLGKKKDKSGSANGNSDSNDEKIVYEDDEIKILFEYIYFSYNDENVKDVDWGGYVFWK